MAIKYSRRKQAAVNSEGTLTINPLIQTVLQFPSFGCIRDARPIVIRSPHFRLLRHPCHFYGGRNFVPMCGNHNWNMRIHGTNSWLDPLWVSHGKLEVEHARLQCKAVVESSQPHHAVVFRDSVQIDS
jgi:hypothetical protein